MEALRTSSPQLGKILVTAGLLTEGQLTEALAEQERTRRRLGEIVVARGFVSGPALANALAEQHGGILKTEYGIAVGLGGEVAAAAAIPGVETEPAPAPEVEPEPVVAESPAAAAEAEVVAIFSQLLDEREALIEQLRADMRQKEDRVEQTREELARLRAELEQAQAELARLRTELDEAKSELARRGAPEPAPRIWVETRELAPPEPAPTHGTHLLSVPTEAGYVLIERPGPAPSPGGEIDLGEEYGGAFVVRKVALVPANGRQCAYLQRP